MCPSWSRLWGQRAAPGEGWSSLRANPSSGWGWGEGCGPSGAQVVPHSAHHVGHFLLPSLSILK